MLKTKSMPTLTNKHLYHLYTLINIGFAGDPCNAILGGYLELPYALILTKNPTPCARPVGPAMGIAIAINCTKPVINESLTTRHATPHLYGITLTGLMQSIAIAGR